MTGFVFGSWLGTGFATGLLILLLGGLAWMASTGRLADPLHLNIPVVHPWPPAGYYVNPFNPNDKSDLVSQADADAVKRDFLQAGRFEDQALARNDSEALRNADTGKRYDGMLDVLRRQQGQGVVSRLVQTSIDKRVVGRLPDPNDASVTWCVQEAGSETTETVSMSTGAVLKRETYRFDDRFWLARVGGKWLITDALIRAQPVQ